MPLPPLAHRWSTALLGSPPPEESLATCAACPMQGSPGRPSDGRLWFGETKCCTYRPTLHNFLVGRILREPAGSRGRAWVEDVIARGAGSTPLGMAPGQSTRLVHGAMDPEAIGRSRSACCPLYEPSTGTCGIWAHREATCATWYCKHERAALGQEFWWSLRDALQALEQAVARWLCVELSVGPEALRRLQDAPRVDVEDLDGVVDPVARRARWGGWSSREREFYEECARVAEALAPERVLAIGGSELSALGQVLRWRHAALQAPQPEGPLRFARAEIIGGHRDGVLLRTHSRYDLAEVSPALLAALASFDGRPTSEVVPEIAERTGIVVTADLLRTLLDFRLLVPADPA